MSTITAGAKAGSQAAGLLRFLLAELKPKGKIVTPFNIVSGAIILLGAALIGLRFARGLGAVTNLSQDSPWGLWIGFDVVTGVAFAGGAYVLTFMVYILGLKKYHSIVRATVLNGFLAYVFYAGALLLDLGRPWNVVNPIIGRSFGVSSVLFLVAWHFMLYMIAELVEFFPAVAEWLGWRRVRRFVLGMTVGAVIFGITLSTLHQSGLGALFLMARGKIHPLWYSEFIPILFFVSSIFAGLSMVIIEGTISHRVFRDRIDERSRASHGEVLLGLGRVAAGALFVYFFIKVLALIHGMSWNLLATPMGALYLTEMIGFVLLPLALFVLAVRRGSMPLLRTAAIAAAAGIIFNRLNISIIAFNWDSPVRYVPSWMEIVITLAVIFAEIWVFRWVVNRMPVMGEAPAGAAGAQTRVPEGGRS